MRILIAALALLFTAEADAQTPTPVWRLDPSHLEADRTSIGNCLESDAGRAAPASCIRVVHQACYSVASPELADTTGFKRRCNLRAIAAWEDEMAEVRAALRAEMRPEELPVEDAAHAAFETFLDANTRSYGVEFEGGSFAPIAAGDARARMLAERTLELHVRLADR